MRRRALPALAAVAVAGYLAVQLAMGASLGSAERDLDDRRRALEAARGDRDRAAAERADRSAQARVAEDELDALRSRLDALELALGAGATPAVADLLADLQGARTDLEGANVRLLHGRSEVGALRTCFVSVTQALSLVSLDHRAEALDVLGSAAPRCREAGAAR